LFRRVAGVQEDAMPDVKAKGRPAGPWFKSQIIMRRVCLALTPALLGGVYFFGWRAAALCAWTVLCACATESFLARRRGDPLTEAALVSGMLLGLSLPPTLPFWMASVAALVAMSFGKEFFGGFGRNVFNPAIVGRAFIYVCFPVEMTRGFTPAYSAGIGGFGQWGSLRALDGMDAVSAATPLWVLRDYGWAVPLKDLFLGGIGGTFPLPGGGQRVLAAGSIGEVSALLLLAGGVYLLLTGTAQWRLLLSSIAGAVLAVLVLRHGFGVTEVPPLAWSLCSGALLYGCLFMVTDPVSAPKDKTTQLIYGALIGALIVFMRWKAVFAGGVGFAILLGNTIGPSVELAVKGLSNRRKPTGGRSVAEAAAPAGGAAP
jgi:Na+-transporting NADH:ubiquinone oxidoreductase subunit B